MSEDEQKSGTVPIRPKVLHRFYEPLILLKALNVEMKDSVEFVDSENEGSLRDPEKKFQAFVYKLAHVCDSVKGNQGGTITSVMVLEPHFAESDIVEYRFASNDRTDNEVKGTSNFVLSLLGHLRTAIFPKDEPAVRGRLLRHILEFNRHRIASYLTAILAEVKSSLAKCLAADDDEDNTIATILRRLLALLEFNWGKSASKTEYIDGCVALLRELIPLQRSNSSVGKWIRRRAREVRGNRLQSSSSCWPEMWHMVNRLVSYAQDVEFFILAKKEWPELFESYRVRFVPSSVAIPGPTRPKSMEAEGIVGRMTSKEKEIKIFRDFVRDLQLTGLDARIKAEYTKNTFWPIVHSEILLLDDLEKSGPITPERFFHGWMYIGSSKPLCRLCQYYFEEHRSGVEHRKSHRNVYTSWRMPDVLTSQGTEGQERRQLMVNRMTERVRRDAFDLIRKRAQPAYRNHDSFTSSMKVTLPSITSDVASQIGSLALEDSDDSEGGAILEG
ncbi:hypothetical protein LZ31DRAFT_636528 [Colletotrichum somersetense]|nr:hypothetical protein LZ31DRAFT_636528 [Colletotrichum somersetense]